MSTETDAQNDLALNPEDAENVVGGVKKKKAQKKAAVHHASSGPANSAIIVVAPPLLGDRPEPDPASQSDDPDC